LLLDRRLLELWVLELDGTIAAVQYAFRYGTTVFQLQEGFDSSRSSDRVGFILRGKVLEALIAEGVRKYDFLAGQPGYKARWSVQVGHYDDLHFARPFSLGSTYLQAVNGGQEGKKWLRTHLPQSAWAALHRANLRVRGRPANQSATPDSTD
jgi:CelD/BcsL family acetyltransferase involved in cellulose biosynthesis